MRKQVELTDKTVLVVGLPEDAFDIDVNNLCNFLGYSNKETGSFDDIITLPQGDWQLVGIHSELTEEECSKIVEKVVSWSKIWETMLEPYIKAEQSTFKKWAVLIRKK